jgi:hypothetical protein
MTTTTSVPEELALLAYDDDGGLEIGGQSLDYGLAGAVLLELALAGRLEVREGRVSVIDPAPTGDPVVDGALASIRADDKSRRPKEWVTRLAKNIREPVLDGLVSRGVLRREEDRVLWVFPRTRYPAAHGVEPPAETDARGRLVAAVLADGPVEPRTAALCALVRAVGLERKVFTDQPRAQVRNRLKEISRGDWAADAVRRAIEDVEAAITATIAVTATTTAAANT